MTDLLQILAAGIGTVAFGALFGVPSKYYPYCGLIGASGWAVYVFLWMRTGFWSEAVVVFLATVLVILMSRFYSIRVPGSRSRNFCRHRYRYRLQNIHSVSYFFLFCYDINRVICQGH